MISKPHALIFIALLFSSCSPSSSEKEIDYVAYKTPQTIRIDGIADEVIWESANTYHIDQRWLGTPFTENDFSGSFKLSWDDEYLYLLAEIRDDSLLDQYEGLSQYWDDDILEIFVDENASGGNHQYNHSAFAYHVDTNLDVIDIGVDSSAHYFNDHVEAQFTKNNGQYIWEAAIKIFDDSFARNTKNTPVTLTRGKKMGFALAYCDNDTSATRENFIGSEVIKGEDKNRGWIDAGIFGLLELRE